MKLERFKELEERSKGNQMQLCYEIFCETKQVISRDDFDHFFPLWLGMFGNKSISQAIEYFKTNKIK